MNSKDIDQKGLSAGHMKAWRLPRFGLSNIQLDEIPIPAPGPKEILIRVGAVSLNYRDKMVIEGYYDPNLLANGPLIIVSDAAGTVTKIGKEVTRFQVGDRVTSHIDTQWVEGPRSLNGEAMLGGPLNGGLADYMLLPESGAVFTPAYLSDEEASRLPTAALTAWLGLHAAADTQPGDTVLIQGTGNVSLFAIQFASTLKAVTIVTTSQDEKGEQAKLIGASHIINYKEEPEWGDAVLNLTQGKGADRVLEVAGGDIKQSSLAARNEGIIAVIGFLNGFEVITPIMPLLSKQLRIQGVAVGPRKSFEAMNAHIEHHQLKPVIDKIYSFDNATEAFQHLVGGGFGKIVIEINHTK